MIRRLEDTGQVFELTRAQEQYLLDRGVGRTVLDAMPAMNQDAARTASAGGSDLGDDRIGRPSGEAR